MLFLTNSPKHNPKKQFTLTIRSGGQAGADRGILDAAMKYKEKTEIKKSLLIDTTGWCPKGRLAEDGIISADYLLEETSTSDYSQRTEWNIRDSDATLVLVLPNSILTADGTSLTIEKTKKLKKPSKVVLLNDDDIAKDTSSVIVWMRENKVKVLNVAGPRESNSPGISKKAYKFMYKLLQKLNEQQYNTIEVSQKKLINAIIR